MNLTQKIAAARALLKQKTDEVTAHVGKTDKSAEHLAATKALTDELNALNDELDGLLSLQKAVGRNAVDASAEAGTAGAFGHNSGAQARKTLTNEEKLGVAIGALVMRNASPWKSPLQCMDELGFGDVAKEFDTDLTRRKAIGQNASNQVAGGLLVPEMMANDIIEILRPQTAFLQGTSYGMRRLPMPNGNAKLPAGATGASASYQQEGDPAAITGITFREVDLSVKTLTAVIPMTQDLVNFSVGNAKSFVQQDLEAAMSQTMDSGMIRGDGTRGNPQGIFKIPGVTSLADTNTNTPTYTQIETFCRAMLNALGDSYVPQMGVSWIFGQRVVGYLQDLRGVNGDIIYPMMQLAHGSKMFKGFGVIETQNIPVNLNTQGGSNETEIGLIAWPQVIMGESKNLEIAVSSEAAIEVGGQVISLFQRRMLGLLAVMQHDVGLRHLGAVVVGTAVKWGR